jgi:NAD(P)-dependent dehydrogenase (short-subunit alcohol dehydrogenase family)
MHTVMITGAAGHLGRAVAQAFLTDGARVVLVDRDAAALRAAFGTDDERRLLAAADLLDAAQVREVVGAALRRHGRIHAMCHLAGGFCMGERVHETPDATWTAMFDLNLRTLLQACRAVVPHMIAAGGGRIASVGALSSRQGLAGMGAYCAAKDAVLRVSEAMAAELAPNRIRVNCVLPSIIDTPANRAAMPDADPSGWVAPQDIADTLVWLSSDRACAVQGVALPLTGRE